MTQIESLTPEQEALIPVVRDEWINRLNSCPKLDVEAASKGMEWLYKLAGYPKPEIVIANSPHAAKEIAKKHTDDVSFSHYGNISDFGWTAELDFYSRIGVKFTNEQWGDWLSFIKSGIYDSIQLEKLAIIVEMPEYIKRDKEGNLHSVNSPAIAWRDGYELYFMWGVAIPKELFLSIAARTITQKEVFAISNQEVRMAALRVLGAEYVLTPENSKLLDTSTKGDELYEVTGVIDDAIYAVKYKCPSTGKVYVDFVHPDVGSKKDATLAMASKGRLTKFELENNVVNHT